MRHQPEVAWCQEISKLSACKVVAAAAVLDLADAAVRSIRDGCLCNLGGTRSLNRLLRTLVGDDSTWGSKKMGERALG